jgi:hypothetical protein
MERAFRGEGRLANWFTSNGSANSYFLLIPNLFILAVKVVLLIPA